MLFWLQVAVAVGALLAGAVQLARCGPRARLALALVLVGTGQGWMAAGTGSPGSRHAAILAVLGAVASVAAAVVVFAAVGHGHAPGPGGSAGGPPGGDIAGSGEGR